ncbi:MAG: master DNA invertase Mpi family serine-type recombinase [Dysgonamonadaceae bacterium]|jgi:DNA invertase Pin-like site-specific DNA recombinase|nr:master DNA invertase Mpi family serine-type recombinase [Dysgonamonadaceae bacterium]
MTYGYLRVSTDEQDAQNQTLGIKSKAEQLGVSVSTWVEDSGISGTKEPENRKLGIILKEMKEGDIIIASELSRLGRKTFMVMRILELCMKNGVKVYTVKDGYELGDNIQSKVLAFAFGLAAEIERDMISQRTKEALARKKAEGVILGRPKGSKAKKNKLTDHKQQIITMLKKGVSQNTIARTLGVHRHTVNAFVKENLQLL